MRTEAEALVRFKCDCGAVLGVVRRSPAKVTSMVVVNTDLYGRSPGPTDSQLEVAMEKSRVEVQGNAWLTCGFCGRRRRWHAAEVGMKRLLTRMEARKK